MTLKDVLELETKETIKDMDGHEYYDIAKVILGDLHYYADYEDFAKSMSLENHVERLEKLVSVEAPAAILGGVIELIRKAVLEGVAEF